MTFEPWPDNLPVDEQITRLADVLLRYYGERFDRSEGAMEMAARLLTEHAVIDPSGQEDSDAE